MTDLDTIVATHLDEQPPVRTPAFDDIRHRARTHARRRTAVAGLCVVALAAAAMAGVRAAGSDSRPDQLTVPATDPLVPDGATAVEVCPAAPMLPGREKLCGSSEDEAVVGELVRLVNAPPVAPTGRRDCGPVEANEAWLTLRFSNADGEGAAVQINACVLSGAHRPNRPPAYAADVYTAAIRLLRPAPPRSTKQGCAAVLEDVEHLVATKARSQQSDVAYAVQMAEVTIAEQRSNLTPEQLAIANELYDTVDTYLYDVPDSDGVLRGLEQLRARCAGS
ncbi:MAG: hypothetical protein QOE05_2405 [Actinomycetota bacterium]|jgi:hypothetical protein|nr:hypothetical protein [Actinomycetota bacterium]